MSRRPRRHGPFLSDRGFALLLNTMAWVLIALTASHCLRS